MNMLETLQNLLNDSGFVSFFADGGWKNLVMIPIKSFTELWHLWNQIIQLM